jgi:hypothetical protein
LLSQIADEGSDAMVHMRSIFFLFSSSSGSSKTVHDVQLPMIESLLDGLLHSSLESVPRALSPLGFFLSFFFFSLDPPARNGTEGYKARKMVAVFPQRKPGFASASAVASAVASTIASIAAPAATSAAVAASVRARS